MPANSRWDLIRAYKGLIQITKSGTTQNDWTSHVERTDPHKFHYQLGAQCLRLLYDAATCFGHTL